MVRKSLLPLVALVFAACASTTQPPAAIIPPQNALLAAQAPGDLTGLRKDLEQTYAQIVARESPVADAPAVDVEAAASMPIPDNRLVRGAVSLFSTNMRGDIQTYLTRSARYKKMIDKALVEAGLPKGLAYLPVIESGYSQTLTSRAGARGMWQFMDYTAREYGLRVDWWVDERADPERSTLAAARYLKDLYRQFNDWPLALAAYNAGPGRIRRALQSTSSSTFWDLCELGAIPKETRGYVPTFYATLLIASDPTDYGFHLAAGDDPQVRKVEVEGPVSLRYVALYAGVDPDTIRDLNPSFRRGMLPPGKSSIRVPAKVAEVIASRGATLKNEDPEIAVCSFRMREGDSIKRLARALGTTPDTLIAMNGLRTVREVGEGDSIYLPVRARELGTLLNSADAYYAVRKGDTLYTIARKYHLTVSEIRDMNELGRRSTIHPGQKLRVSAPRTLAAGGM